MSGQPENYIVQSCMRRNLQLSAETDSLRDRVREGTHSCRRLTIHRSGRGKSCSSSSSENVASARAWYASTERSFVPNCKNLAAFQILFVRLRDDVTRSRDRFTSCPGVLPVASVWRSASHPYSHEMSRGSTTLPSDLDILRPCTHKPLLPSTRCSRGLALKLYRMYILSP